MTGEVSGNRHRTTRRPPNSTWIIGVLVVALVAVTGALIYSHTRDSLQPSLTTEGAVSPAAPFSTAPLSPSAPTTSTPPPPTEASTVATIDAKGFVGSHARCDVTDSAVAIGRTDLSLVVVCWDGRANYSYRGVRLSDGAASEFSSVKPVANTFVVTNGDVTYSVTPTELLISSGGEILAREPMLEYDGIYAGTSATSKPTVRPQTQPQAPVAPQAASDEYPAAPLTGRGTGDGEVWFTTSAPWLVNYEVVCNESAILAYIDTVTANESPLGYDDLHGSTAANPADQAVGRGTTNVKTAIGRMKVRVSTAPDCSWQVGVVSAA